MKVLSLALVGLCGYAGSAMAACPTDPAAPTGAWSSKSVSAAAMNIDGTHGLAGTECSLAVALNQNSALFAKSFVVDNSPQNETHYRARFYIDTTNLTGFTSILRASKIFSAAATTAPAGFSTDMVSMSLVGTASGPAVRIYAADSAQTSGAQVFTVPLPNANGVNRIEIDMPQGNAASFRYWVSKDTDATADNAPTNTTPITVNNSGWSGVKTASMGIMNASNGYRANYTNTSYVWFDQFDSRRQTFIGQ